MNVLKRNKTVFLLLILFVSIFAAGGTFLIFKTNYRKTNPLPYDNRGSKKKENKNVCLVSKEKSGDKTIFSIRKYNFSFSINLNKNQDLNLYCDDKYPKNSDSVFNTKDSKELYLQFWGSDKTILPQIRLEGWGTKVFKLKNGATKVYSYDGEGPFFSCYQLYFFLPVENNSNVRRIYAHAYISPHERHCFVPNDRDDLMIRNIVKKYYIPGHEPEISDFKGLFAEIDQNFTEILNSRPDNIKMIDELVTKTVESIEVLKD